MPGYKVIKVPEHVVWDGRDLCGLYPSSRRFRSNRDVNRAAVTA